MSFYFVWKSVNIANNEIMGVYEQEIHANGLQDAVAIWTAMHGDLWEDENGNAYEITSIKEIR